ARYLRQEVREKAQDIKDDLGGKVESAAQEVQRLGQEVRDEAQDIKDELGGKVESAVHEVQRLRQELGSRPDSSAGVKIQMRIDCETIPDPHSRLETSGTLVTDSQGTQACDDELVVTRTSEGRPGGTQDSQAGSREIVVIGSDELPSSQGVLNFIAHRYFQTVNTT
ncbi:unnamed protein product, partial [Pocillopora meandrina]